MAELRVALEIEPWGGTASRRDIPEGTIRTLPFGTVGFAVYLILEVIWLG